MPLVGQHKEGERLEMIQAAILGNVCHAFPIKEHNNNENSLGSYVDNLYQDEDKQIK